ncbi:MAG: hypothetical protein JRI36_13630 [Deltaproteobacteria bacterium]|nr:hypothetical protein [Deltaproteobacteria bacterium]
MSKKVCYCFGYTEDDIIQDVKENGMSTITLRISEEAKKGTCECKTKNPKGR